MQDLRQGWKSGTVVQVLMKTLRWKNQTWEGVWAKLERPETECLSNRKMSLIEKWVLFKEIL